ncbi:hypothetical protein [Carnobacterium divergens]|nr:hypothetical protein [Carnobacterium divergens]
MILMGNTGVDKTHLAIIL